MMTGAKSDPGSVAPIDDLEREQRAMARAVRQALIEHKRAGRSIVVWEDDRVRWIPAEKIVVPDEPA